MRAFLIICLLCMLPCADGLRAAGSSVLCDAIHTVMNYVNGSVVTEYNCSGSGEGKAALFAGEIDFAASDSVLTVEQRRQYPDLQMVPISVTPIGVIYNLPGVHTLVLSRDVIVKIFTKVIIYWDDPRISIDNPTANLPRAAIIPVVRADGSGSTEIFTHALSSFSPVLWPYGVGSKWPTAVPLSSQSGGHTLLSHVANTAYTISYSGMASVASMGVSFAVVKNKIDNPTLPGWADGDTTAAGFTFDPTTLITNMTEGIGYPITGVSYIIFSHKSPTLCKFLHWLHWMLHNTTVDTAISQTGLVPTAYYTRNMAFDRMATPSCPSLLQQPFIVSAAASDEKLMNSVGYSLSSSDERYLRFNDSSYVTLTGGQDGYANFPVALEGVEMAVNFGIAISNIELDMAYIGKILSKEIQFWNDSRLRERSSFLPVSDEPLVVVTDETMAYYNVMLSALGLANSGYKPDIVLSSPDRVADYVKLTPNTFAVVPSQTVVTWKLSKVQPIYDGVPTASYATVTSNVQALNYNKKTFEIKVPLSTMLHPFFRVLTFDVKRNVVAPHCERDQFEIIEFILSAAGQDLMKAEGFIVFPSIVEDLKNRQLPTLQCNGDTFIVPGSTINKTAWIAAGAVVGAVLFVIIACLLGHWMAERRKHHKLLNENIFAAQSISEALVMFDLEEAKRALVQCQLPETMARAFSSLITNLDSYKAYLPESCLHGNSEEDLLTSNSETECTEVTPTRPHEAVSGGGSSGSFTSGQMLKKRLRYDLKAKKVSLVVVNIVGFHTVEDVKETLGKYLLLIAKITSDTNGIRDGFSGDKVYLSWNGAKGNINHLQNAGKAARMISQACEREGIETTVGMSCGGVRCGVLGTDKMKKFTIVGRVVGWVCALERLNKLYETRVLTDADVRNDYYSYLVDQVLFPKIHKDPVEVYSIGEEKEVRNNEWMYQLQESSLNDPLRDYNLGMRSYLTGDYAKAKAELLSIEDPPPRALQVIQLINKMGTNGPKPTPVSALPFGYF